MSISNIINHLEQEHQARLTALAKDKAGRLAVLESQWGDRFREAKEKILLEYQNKSSQKLAQLSFKQKEALQREILQKKQALLDEFLDNLWQALLVLPEKDYEQLLKGALLKLPKTSGKIQISAESEKLFVKLLKEMKRTDEVLLNKKMNDRGFIYQNEKLTVDYSFRFVLRQLKEEKLIELNKSLFE